ncbi:MAG: DEAD/DEAH box helicase family protein [Burkholderiales bacterium]
MRRALTEQDRTLYALCRPQRLLRMALQFTVFDGGRRKIARYQQFFAVERIVERVRRRDEAGRRAGGIVWHTQGSGKSLTMVMLAKALVLELDIRTPRIVLVTDRVDLDKQLGSTFAACGLTPDRAESGRHLVELVNEPVNIFDEEAFHQVVEEQARGRPTAAKADMIAHATKRAITERLDEDPAFYEKFSKLIQQAIDDYRAGRISDLEYLKRAGEIRESVVNRKTDDVPEVLRGKDHAIACFGILEPYFGRHIADSVDAKSIAADAATSIWAIVERNRVVGFWDNLDAQRRTMNDLDDYLYDVIRGECGIPLATEEMDEIINRSMQLARHRMPA